MQTTRSRKSPWLYLLLVLICSAFVMSRTSSASDWSPDPYFPEVSAHHFKMAEEYRKKAEEYRNEAEKHRKMAEHCDLNSSKKDCPKERKLWLFKLGKNCRDYAERADKLAKSSDESAAFHEEIAKELKFRGK